LGLRRASLRRAAIGIMLQRTLPAGFIAPCLPTKTNKLPSGSQWLHEIKHDGFRVVARKESKRVRLYSDLVISFCFSANYQSWHEQPQSRHLAIPQKGPLWG
jgi:hypothetical protein